MTGTARDAGVLGVPGSYCERRPDPTARPRASPLVTGRTDMGQILTEDADGIANASFSYQWRSDDSDTPGATGPTCMLADVGERRRGQDHLSAGVLRRRPGPR